MNLFLIGVIFVPIFTQEESVWLNRNQMAELFGRDVKTIGKHIINALQEELEGDSVVANFATTASDGKTYSVEHYKDGRKTIEDSTLVALTIMLAESKPDEKEMMISVVMNCMK